MSPARYPTHEDTPDPALPLVLDPRWRCPRDEAGGPLVLFVCEEDACCSRVAAAWARALGGRALRVATAGTDPAPAVDPVAAQVLRTRGLALDTTAPRHLDPTLARAADLVVLLGVVPARVPGTLRWRATFWDLSHPPRGETAAMAQHVARLERCVAALLEPPPRPAPRRGAACHAV